MALAINTYNYLKVKISNTEKPVLKLIENTPQIPKNIKLVACAASVLIMLYMIKGVIGHIGEDPEGQAKTLEG